MKTLKFPLIFTIVSACVLAAVSLSAAYSRTSSYDVTASPEELAKQIISQLEKKEYQEVSGFLSYLLEEKLSGINGTRVLDGLYDALSVIDRETLWDTWIESGAGGHWAFIVRGEWFITKAYEVRGSGYSYTITAERRGLMEEYIALARKDLEQAYKMEPGDPNSAATMILLCTMQKCSEQVMEEWFRRAVKADSGSMPAYHAKINYLSPSWYGNQLKMKKFAESCYKNSPPGSIVYTIMFDYINYNILYKSRNRKVYLGQPDVQELVSNCLQRWETDFPNSTAAKMMRAKFAGYLGNYFESFTIYNNLLEKNPDFVEALAGRAGFYIRREEFKKAEKDYLHVLEVEPDNEWALLQLARITFRHFKNYEKALMYVDQAILLDPRDKRYYFTRADFHAEMKNYKEAIQDLTTVLALDNRFQSAYMKRASLYEKTGQKDRAVEDYLYLKKMGKGFAASARDALQRIMDEKQDGNAVSSSAEPAVTQQQAPKVLTLADMMDSAEILYFRGQSEKAVELLEKILSLDPKYGPALFFMGQMKEKLDNEYEEALTYYSRAVSSDEKNKEYLLKKGYISYLLRKYDDAIEDLSALIVLSPQDEYAFYYRGLCYDALQKKEKAFTDMQRASMYSTNIPEVIQYLEEHRPIPESVAVSEVDDLTELANSDMVMMRYASAERNFRKILEIEPENDNAYFQLGLIALMHDRNRKAAISFYSKAIELNDEYGDYYLNRAALYQAMGKLKKALADYNRLLELKPTYGKGYVDRAECYQKLKKYKEAEADYKKALKYGSSSRDYIKRCLAEIYVKTGSAVEEIPENVVILLQRAEILAGKNEIDAAVKDLKAVLAIDPTNDSAYYLLAKIAKKKQRDPEKALSYFSKAIELDSANRDYYFQRGQVYFEKEDYAHAESDFTQAIRLAPENGQAYYYRGVTNQKLGNKQQATDDFIKLMKYSPSWTETAKSHLRELRR